MNRRLTRGLAGLLFTLFAFGLQAQMLSPMEIALRHIDQHIGEWGLTANDIADMKVDYEYRTAHNGLTHIYFLQTHEGIEIYNAILNVNIKDDGEVLYVGRRFVADAASKVNGVVPGLSPEQAIEAAANILGLEYADDPRQLSSEGPTSFRYTGGDLSAFEIPVELKYQLSPQGNLILSWALDIKPLNGDDHWSLRLDATTGELVNKNNYTIYCNSGSETGHTHDQSCASGGKRKFLPLQQAREAANAGNFNGAPTYRVFGIPTESPNHGDQSLEIAPANATASPAGWHDDGITTYTYTRGNNVWAYPDYNADSNSDFNVDGGASLTFDWTYDPDAEPGAMKEASTTNLFYLNNIMHDVFYLYGFDEAAGNFQRDNFGNGGNQGDNVVARGSFGGNDPIGMETVNNANFSTPPDGGNGVMRMYHWNTGARLIEVTEPMSIAGLYTAGTAEYGPTVQDMPVSGPLVEVDDDITNPYATDGCEDPFVNAAELDGAIALVDRGGCFFEQKTVNAEAAGAVGVIICNFEDGVLGLAGVVDIPNPGIPTVSMKSSDCAILRQFIADGIQITLAEPTDGGPEFLTSDFDNGVIAHEYTHGISIRLTGGPGNSGCLTGASEDVGEQMGEGWSDFLGLVLTAEPGDEGSDRRGMATYLRREVTIAKGLRAYPYSTDMNENPLTYNDIVSASVPHGVGTVWCTMLWDMYWAFVDQYGWSDDIYDGTAGNNMAIQLVIDAMKIQPCNPGFVDGRDAILAADEALFGGENACMIWEVFARRGLGYYADQGSTFDNRDGEQNFDPLPTCIPELKITKTADEFIDAGDEVDFEIHVINHKPETVTGVVVTDELPDGLTYVAGSANIEPEVNGSMLSWDLGDLNFEDEETITYSAVSDLNNYSVKYFFEDFETSNQPNWGTTYIGEEAPNYWEITTLFSNSGDQSYFVENIAQESQQVLQTIVPETVNGSEPALRFYHRYDTEPGADAGLVEVSTDFGETWEGVGEDMFLNGYNGPVAYGTFTVPNIQGFWGNSGGWIPTFVDLSNYSGQEILLRFRFGTSEGVAYLGWFVDDVELMDVFYYNSEACVTSNEGDFACDDAEGRGTIVESQFTSDVTEALETELNVNIFPNPVEDVLNISLDTDEQTDLQIQILTVDGRAVYSRSESVFGFQNLQLSTTDLPSGIYFVRLSANGRNAVRKVVVR
ncbi:MAG: T9SS type A sorting domain-containing protein [Bacteroidetes bacterium]|nr:T9SS type A sorting domain-containing protein [Bacteroidota bacterium]